jgi:CelD/BcsL family acetyltransferase involved in cellulose biosynthesis
MNTTVTAENLENLKSYWLDAGNGLDWPDIFILPPWLEAWWQVFGAGEIHIRIVRRGDSIIGIAPVQKLNDTVSFIGGTDVCDYQDFIVVKGREEDYFNALLDDFVKSNVKELDLKHLRPDSLAMKILVPLAMSRGYQVSSLPEDVNVEMDLPHTWDEYLESLDTRQRHEVRRKLRRLQEAGNLEFSFITDVASVPGAMDMFFKMFTESSRDKASFLTEKMEAYFRLLAANMAQAGLLKLGVLKLDNKPVAQIICFDYHNCLYLYNSGYDPGYESLSAGLLSKVLAIKGSIEKGKNKFDFLKGSETYKYHLGGKEVPLYRCCIDLSG